MTHPATTLELVIAAQAGDDRAASMIARHFERLVRAIAAPYYMPGAEPEDVVSEGMIGLVKAIRTYDPDRDSGFPHFAALCVRAEIQTAVTRSRREKRLIGLQARSLSEPTIQPDPNGDATIGATIADRTSLGTNPERAVIDLDTARAIRELIRTGMSAMESEALIAVMSGRPYVELVQTLGVPAKTIDNAVQRARRKVRNLLDPTQPTQGGTGNHEHAHDAIDQAA
ncbi:MAG TPA: sigma-70 family RNA polymerase sigma factor [Solirubrobacterales bacterium]|nr:sigma-70 family RNA polymerase sigma factor [Solirubrobacterales bacterium]